MSRPHWLEPAERETRLTELEQENALLVEALNAARAAMLACKQDKSNDWDFGHGFGGALDVVEAALAEAEGRAFA